MRELVVKTGETYHALGDENFSRPNLEKENKIFRRSLYFVEDLKAGDVITKKHIRRIRPVLDWNRNITIIFWVKK